MTTPSLRATLYVPRLFEPLIPGSAYPNRRLPIPARGRPGILLAAPAGLFARAAAPLAERGLVVLQIEPGADLAAAAAWLAAQPECAGARVGAELVGTGAGDSPNGVAALAAVAVLAAGMPATPDGAKVLVARAVAGGAPEENGESRTRGVVEKWYRLPAGHRASDLLPPQAWRDAAEWLAATLESAPRAER